jgi:regulator of replication initiation timing
LNLELKSAYSEIASLRSAHDDMSAKPCDKCNMIMVNYTDLWLVHSHIASLLDGARLKLKKFKDRSTFLGDCTSCPLLRYNLDVAVVEIKDLKHKFDHSSCYTILSLLYEACVSLKSNIFYAIKENTELQQEVAYLTTRLEKTVLSEKMIEEDFSRFEESATKSIYRLCVGFERCEKKGEKSGPKFIPTFSYHKEEKALKPTKTHYPSNPKPSFNPKRDVKRETPKPRDDTFICMFCGRAGHLDEFYFRRKRIERRHVEYDRNSYRDEFFDVPAQCYSRILPRSYSRASPRTFSHALPQFAHVPNHCSHGFGPRENRFEPRCFSYGLRPHRGNRFPCRPSFPSGGSFPHFEPRLLDGPRFPRCGSRPTQPSGEVQRTVKTSSCRMVKCWIRKIYLTHPSTEPSTPSHSV